MWHNGQILNFERFRTTSQIYAVFANAKRMCTSPIFYSLLTPIKQRTFNVENDVFCEVTEKLHTSPGVAKKADVARILFHFID